MTWLHSVTQKCDLGDILYNGIIFFNNDIIYLIYDATC